MLPDMSDQGRYPVLPQGRYVVNLEDVHKRFVVDAPYRESREQLWIAFKAWHQQATAYFPGATVFLDGSFVTWKPWEPPQDVDVTIFARKEQFLALEPWKRPDLFTMPIEGTDRVRKPQNGLVDANWATIGMPERVEYWTEFYSSMRDQNGKIMEQSTKGFLEVTL